MDIVIDTSALISVIVGGPERPKIESFCSKSQHRNHGDLKMHVYTYPEARQNLAQLLEQAENSGKVLIRRKDGRTFSLVTGKNRFFPFRCSHN